jgi:hypothetical protein
MKKRRSPRRHIAAMPPMMPPTMLPVLDVVFVESDPDIVEVMIWGIQLVVGVNRCKT